jgi:hypothetical protein
MSVLLFQRYISRNRLKCLNMINYMERIGNKMKSDQECEDKGESCVKWFIRREWLSKKIKE